MSKERKGFVIYGDTREVVRRLSDEEAGQLLKGMLDYFVDSREPKFKGVLEFVFIPIKQQMDRDADKYEAKCVKMRENAQKRWQSTNEYKSMQLHANDANTKTNTNTDTNTKKDTDTDTTTNTNVGGGGRYKCDDEFNIWKRLTPEDIDVLYEKFPNSGGLLIDKVFEEVRDKRIKVKSGLNYILGYAKNVGWDDNADHFDGGGMA